MEPIRVLSIVPSATHKQTAGSRIRFHRLMTPEWGFQAKLESFEDVRLGDATDFDVFIFSKTYSTEAGVLARRLHDAGKTVGIDLFDDYFSQFDDARLLRFRQWLEQFGDFFDFALCSTNVMRRIAESYFPDLPVLVVPDPYPKLDRTGLAAQLSNKLARTRQSKRLDVLWFGIGSNPFFSVGLKDLAAYSWCLADLANGPITINLRVLTDEASQTSDNLARLARLPVPYRVETWSLEKEEEALRSSFACFIPVNGQSFSRAKSLNRAVTAILAGNQVLSPGFPLYGELSRVVYSDAVDLLEDIERGSCRASESNLTEIAEVTSAASEVGPIAARLGAFLRERLESRYPPPRSGAAQAPISAGQVPGLGILHGISLDKSVAPVLTAAGVLSVKTPLTRANIHFDVRVEQDGHDAEIWIKPELRRLVSSQHRAILSEPKRLGKYAMVKVGASRPLPLGTRSLLDTGNTPWTVLETSAYEKMMLDIDHTLRAIFPTVEFYLSDPNPFARATLAGGALPRASRK